MQESQNGYRMLVFTKIEGDWCLDDYGYGTRVNCSCNRGFIIFIK